MDFSNRALGTRALFFLLRFLRRHLVSEPDHDPATEQRDVEDQQAPQKLTEHRTDSIVIILGQNQHVERQQAVEYGPGCQEGIFLEPPLRPAPHEAPEKFQQFADEPPEKFQQFADEPQEGSDQIEDELQPPDHSLANRLEDLEEDPEDEMQNHPYDDESKQAHNHPRQVLAQKRLNLCNHYLSPI